MTLQRWENELRKMQGHWISDTNEIVIKILTRMVPDWTWGNYGKQKGLIVMEEEKNSLYSAVRLTEKGLERAKKLAMTTCAFTGRRVK